MSAVKDLREKAGLSQAQLSELCGIPLSTIQAYEQGSRDERLMSLDFAQKIGDALGVSVAYITEAITYGNKKGETMDEKYALIDNATLDDFVANKVKDGTMYRHKELRVGSIIPDGYDGDLLEKVKAEARRSLRFFSGD